MLGQQEQSRAVDHSQNGPVGAQVRMLRCQENPSLLPHCGGPSRVTSSTLSNQQVTINFAS